MRSSMRRSVVSGAAICVVALSFQVSAATADPESLLGAPTKERISKTCDLPNAMEKTYIDDAKRVIEVSSPAELTIEQPESADFTLINESELFLGVRIVMTGSSFSFEDISDDRRFAEQGKYKHVADRSKYSQFFDIIGIEAVVAEGVTEKGEVASNVYCYVNANKDIDLCAPNDGVNCSNEPPTKITVLWVLGPSGFPGPEELDDACESAKADVILGQPVDQRTVGVVNFSGCNGRIPRYCLGPHDSGGLQNDVGPCDIALDATVMGSCGGSSGGTKVKC